VTTKHVLQSTTTTSPDVVEDGIHEALFLLRTALETSNITPLLAWAKSAQRRIDRTDVLNLLRCASSAIARNYISANKAQFTAVSGFFDDCVQRVAIDMKPIKDTTAAPTTRPPRGKTFSRRG